MAPAGDDGIVRGAVAHPVDGAPGASALCLVRAAILISSAMESGTPAVARVPPPLPRAAVASASDIASTPAVAPAPASTPAACVLAPASALPAPVDLEQRWASLVLRCAKALKRAPRNVPRYVEPRSVALQRHVLGAADMATIVVLCDKDELDDGEKSYVVKTLERAARSTDNAVATAAINVVKLIAGSLHDVAVASRRSSTTTATERTSPAVPPARAASAVGGAAVKKRGKKRENPSTLDAVASASAGARSAAGENRDRIDPYPPQDPNLHRQISVEAPNVATLREPNVATLREPTLALEYGGSRADHSFEMTSHYNHKPWQKNPMAGWSVELDKVDQRYFWWHAGRRLSCWQHPTTNFYAGTNSARRLPAVTQRQLRSGPGRQQPAVRWLPTWMGGGGAWQPRTVAGAIEYVHVAGYRLNVVIPQVGTPRVGVRALAALAMDLTDREASHLNTSKWMIDWEFHKWQSGSKSIVISIDSLHEVLYVCANFNQGKHQGKVWPVYLELHFRADVRTRAHARAHVLRRFGVCSNGTTRSLLK